LPRRVATIDLGTNTVRVLVVEAQGTRWRSLYEAQRVTRLGEGQWAAGRLLDEPIRRTVGAVAEFIAAAEALDAGEVQVVATSAVRDASNREAFVARVRAATGRDITVVSGEEEARLTCLGVSAGLPDLDQPFILFDIGGGSTEVALARGGAPICAVSLGLGVVPLTERYLDEGPVDQRQLALLRIDVEGRLQADLPLEITDASASGLVGTAGTVTALAALDLGLATYDPGRVHGHRLTQPAVEGLLGRLGAMALDTRAALPCLDRGRADVVIAGIVVCLALMERLRRSSLVVSDHGLREGILHRILRPDF
jgi:exopolyphosphatase / guanosine-5'-triphosphate,3'-diphosphate pyrophosphatase